jgi:bis(5'-nucleosyl)-tetraphosphatase (symmetrical)
VPTYAIGDVQGCRRALDRLLKKIRFNADRDRVWFAGDLVNRGPDSVGVLRRVRSLGGNAVTVLGNHDLALLARWVGVRRPKRTDTLGQVMRARDRKKLLEWLLRRPFLHHEEKHVLVHAGLAPTWTAGKAEKWARRAESALRDDPEEFLGRYAAKSDWPKWSDRLAKKKAPVVAAKYLTRLRLLDAKGRPDDTFAGPPEEAPLRLRPWFAHPQRRSTRTTVLFGHWAALGVRMGKTWIALDSGCVWGKTLTAVRLEDRVVYQVAANGRA